MKLDGYKVIDRAVEDGIEAGWNRAHKHTDTPTREVILDEIHMAVMNEISTYVDFSGDDVAALYARINQWLAAPTPLAPAVALYMVQTVTDIRDEYVVSTTKSGEWK